MMDCTGNAGGAHHGTGRTNEETQGDIIPSQFWRMDDESQSPVVCRSTHPCWWGGAGDPLVLVCGRV
jgi:hypothetical protein